ncbi:PREDICTED: uncharacterized protein LOC109125837 [Camelina sativa]|uniref:Uncharacterized protein LOC109125837 n=1 Tax=Camelina sativa TaxID=90675 RepID=A0ABM1QAN6_CAMSA|nr:PREDICTED: uncharacterized protein LOC109125837 [Camelina sativa]
MANSSAPVDHYANPYFLHSLDHAGMNIISDRLTSGADFYSWKRSMRIALNVRNKLGFVDGKIRKTPKDHQDYGSWSRCNDMITTWIINSVDKKIGGSLLYISTAEGIWNNLMSRFKQDDAPKVYELEQKLNPLRQGSMDVTSYYTMLVTLWEEYKNYVELPVCTCGKFECNAATLWEKLQQRSRVTKFLMGLNASYESTRRHILMLKPIPSIEEVFNMVTSDERQTHITPKPNSMIFQASASTSTEVPISYTGSYDNMAFAVQNQSHYRPRGPRPVCTHCGQTGHVIQKCFKLHGYPPGYISGFKSSLANYQGSQGSPRPVMSSAQPRGCAPSNPRPMTHVVANVMTETSPTPTTNAAINLDISTMSSDQITSLIQQLNAKESIQGLMIGKGFLLHNLYILQPEASSYALISSSTSLPHFSGSLKVDGHLWHQRLGHPSTDKLKVLSVWVYLLRNKSQVTTAFPTFLKYVLTQYNTTVKAIRTDNAPELAFTDLIEEHGMIHQFSCAYTPQQNFVVERKHQHLLNVARALLFQSNVPLVILLDIKAIKYFT